MDPNLLIAGEVFSSKKHINSYDLRFLVYIFPYSISTSWISLKTPKQKIEYKYEVPKLDTKISL